MIFTFCMLSYSISMNPKSFEGDEFAFMQKVASNFSFYEYQFYTLVLLPIYLIFISINNIPFIQRIVRLRNKKYLAFDSMKNILISSLLFVAVVYLVGIIYPLIHNVITFNFIYIYALQCILMLLLFMIIGYFVLIIESFSNTKNIVLKIGIPIVIVMIYHIFRKKVFNLFVNINFAVINYANNQNVILTEFIFLIFMLILLLIGIIFIKLYVCSEEEYII